MPARLKDARRKLVGTKRTYRALKEDQVSVCYVARDAEPRVIEPLQRQCIDQGLEIIYVDSMRQLGKYCGIDVGAAAAAILK
ncbi:MAG: 50S ribosomal protein L7Ae-like protein [Firmicutes bacterium]|nr:50S ribosomal protein L7Ae-like protein [Bacillota bacterium]